MNALDRLKAEFPESDGWRVAVVDGAGRWYVTATLAAKRHVVDISANAHTDKSAVDLLLEAWRAAQSREAAALKAGMDDAQALCDRMADLLTRTANALNGEPEPLHLHGWSDLPERATTLKADRDALLAALVRIENATRYDSTRDEGMVAHCIGDYLDWDEVAEALAALPAHLQKEVTSEAADDE